jgi:hypothetical protein
VKAQVKVTPTTIVEVEAAKQKDLFKAIASAHEVFGEKRCGLCGSTEIVPAWRTVTVVKGKKTETYEYPEYHCHGKDENGQRCGARLALGTINDESGTLYPTRKLKEDGQPLTKEDRDAGIEGRYGRHQGWHRWKKEDK